MKNYEIFNHYKKVLDNLIDNSLYFATYIQNPMYVEGGAIYGDDDEYGIPSNISIYTGATRACVVDYDYEWVVKFDIEEDHLGSACEREEQIFSHAVRANLDHYFVEATYIGTYRRTFPFYKFYNVYKAAYVNEYEPADFVRTFYEFEHEFGQKDEITVEVPLYAYHRIDDYGIIGPDHPSEKDKQFVNTHKSPLSERNKAVAYEFMENYGAEEYQRLTDFLVEEQINDIHSGNVGFDEGKFVLIDYAGYHDEEYESEEEEDEE